MPQPVQCFVATTGATVECCTSLPLRLAQPMPRFLMAPPKPVNSWHLKWVRQTSESASTISAATATSGSARP